MEKYVFFAAMKQEFWHKNFAQNMVSNALTRQQADTVCSRNKLSLKNSATEEKMKSRYEVSYEVITKRTGNVARQKAIYTAESVSDAKAQFLSHYKNTGDMSYRIISCVKK